MPNIADFVAIWLGLSGAGCIVALLNTDLQGDALLHCIAAANSRAIIVSHSLLDSVQAISDCLPENVRPWIHGGQDDAWPTFAPGVGTTPSRLPPELAAPALLIYTSGTTGVPKAVIVTHRRILEWSYWFASLYQAGPQDRMYDCLPLYHSVGGLVAVGALLVSGGSIVIRPGFSASRFWDEVSAFGCTMFQYVGELCRYLHNSPPHSLERSHTLRLACGNGLGADIWQGVQERFGIPRMLEFYASTEGTVSLCNLEGKPGAIGRIPPFLRHRRDLLLIRCDPITGEPVRTAAGFCVPCEDGEAGEALGRLSASRRFDGYTDPAATSAKILANVLAQGDQWYRTGDLLRRDAEGYYSFVDRLGDNYRWKGENVSAVQVGAALRSCAGVTDAAVYGIPIPGHDGKAGMAALTVSEKFSPAQLQIHVQTSLPHHAQPLFIRLCKSLDVTGTYKLIKHRLISEGITEGSDPIWFNDRSSGEIIPLSSALSAEIQSGKRHL